MTEKNWHEVDCPRCDTEGSIQVECTQCEYGFQHIWFLNSPWDNTEAVGWVGEPHKCYECQGSEKMQIDSTLCEGIGYVELEIKRS